MVPDFQKYNYNNRYQESIIISNDYNNNKTKICGGILAGFASILIAWLIKEVITINSNIYETILLLRY